MAKKHSSRKRAAAVEAAPLALAPVERLGQALVAPPGWRVPAALALLSLLLSAWTFDAKLSLSGDNTEFITLARSLVQGEGLSYINEPGAKAATKYPFGFPLLLAPLEWLFPGQWVPMKWLVVLLLAGGVPVFYLWARSMIGSVAALAASLVLVTAPLVQDYAHQVMSEVPYLAVSVLALYALERGIERQGLKGNHWLWGGLAALVVAYYLRSVGLVLAAALVLHLLWGRDYRRALVLGGAFLACWLPWTLRNRAVGGGGVYFKQLLLVNPYFPDQGYIDAAGLVQRVGQNLAAYAQVRLPVGFWPELGPGWGLAASLLFVGLAAYGLALLGGRHRLTALYAGLFLLTVVLWPWSGERFVIPLVPLAVVFAVAGAQGGAARLPAGGRLPLLAGLLALVIGLQGLGLGALARRGAGDYHPAWRNYLAAGQWLRANAPAGAHISCRKSYWLYVVADRPSTVYPFEGPEAVVRAFERERVEFAVVDQLGYSSTGRFLVPAIQEYPDRFDVVWHRPNPDTYILRFKAGGR